MLYRLDELDQEEFTLKWKEQLKIARSYSDIIDNRIT
jgi:hypothetical protein